MNYQTNPEIQIDIPLASLTAESSPYPLKRYVVIKHDTHYDNPRDWDNLWTFVYSSSRYYLGDKQSDDPLEYIAEELGIYSDDYEDDAQLVKLIENKALIVPYYAYIHGGTTVFLDSRHATCQWDSGQCGFAYVSKDKLREEYGAKYVTEKIRAKAMKELESEISLFDDYLQGNVFMYKLVDMYTGEWVDSCGGFYGCDWNTNGIMEHVLSANDGIKPIFIVEPHESISDYQDEFDDELEEIEE